MFHVEQALTDAQRARGLMERQAIAEDGGMLFVYPDSRLLSFWMADCLTDMDIVFLDDRGRVTAIHEMKMEPPQGHTEERWKYESRLRRYTSERLAIAAIELRAGMMKELGIQRGDQLEIDLEPYIRIAQME